jgi:CRP/FNR family transcriptional regulator, cyclic AMP receptor protein
MRGPYGFEVNENRATCKLRKPDFFSNHNGTTLKDFDAISSISLYPTGAVLFMEKEYARGLFILCEGQVKLSISSSEGKILILGIAKPGEAFGLKAVLGRKPYQFSAETLRPSQVVFVRGDDFLRFINNHPNVYANIAQHIVSSYERVCDQLRSVGLSSAPRRLAQVLLDWSKARQESTCSRIMMPLTHEEIGEFIGTTRETVTRTLGDFRNSQLITVRGAAVTIRDRKALEKIAAA